MSGRSTALDRPDGIEPITDHEFGLFRNLVYAKTGITLGPQKRHLLHARLGKRLRALGMASFGEYYDHLTTCDPGQEELERFINALTTNKTDFFREPHHFRYLAEVWAPAMRARAARTHRRSLRLWSAACSSGEEPYSLAMTLRDALGPSLDGFDLRILASDIDTDVLARAAAGVYSRTQVAPVPEALLERHFLKGVGANAGLVRVRPELRALITFRRINLLDDVWPIRARLDVIVCRNVLIYFDRPTQQRLLQRLAALLEDDGLLILGHSESLYGLLDGFRHHGNTIYLHEARAPAAGSGAGRPPAPCHFRR